MAWSFRQARVADSARARLTLLGVTSAVPAEVAGLRLHEQLAVPQGRRVCVVVVVEGLAEAELNLVVNEGTER